MLEQGQLINLNHQLINFIFCYLLWFPRNVACSPTLLFKGPKGRIFFHRQQPWNGSVPYRVADKLCTWRNYTRLQTVPNVHNVQSHQRSKKINHAETLNFHSKGNSVMNNILVLVSTVLKLIKFWLFRTDVRKILIIITFHFS